MPYISGERTSFALTILMILLFIIFIQNLRYVFIRSILVFIIFTLIVAITNSGKEDITHRMFVKTYKQLVDKNIDTNKANNNVMEIKIWS